MKSKWLVIGCILVSVSPAARAANLGNLPFGQVQTGTIASPAQTNSYTFSANANDVLDFTMVVTSGNLSPRIQLYNSVGTLLMTANPGFCIGSTIEMNQVKLAATGTYTVIVSDCSATNTGAYALYAQRTNNPSGAANLPLGLVQTGTIGSAAQSNSYTFSGSANDMIDFTMVVTSGSLSPKIRLNNPDGTQLSSANPGFCIGSTLELNTVKLPATGTYTVLFGDCGDTNTGNYSIYMQRTNNPAGAVPLLFGGQSQVGTIGFPALSNSYTFGGSAADTLNFTMTATSGTLSPKIRVYNPDGTLLGSANPGFCIGSTIPLNNVKLPATGTYTVLVGDCADTNTGNYNISAQCFGVCTGPIQLPQTINFGTLPNQVLGAAPFTLSATASSGLPVTFASNTISVCTVSGVVVTLVAVGTCSITASQSGNATYAPASVTQSFMVSTVVASGSGPFQFAPLTPCRILDTRNANGTFGGPFIGGNTTRTIPIPSSACGVPANAAAYSLNVTVVPHVPLGFLTVWPTGQQQPVVSTLNSPNGAVLANAAIVPAGTAGSINVFVTDDTDVIIDINGYFVPPGAGTLQFYPLTPCRVLDTRNPIGTFGGPSLAGGIGRSFPIPFSACGAPVTAAAYSFNVTVVPQGPLGYLTAWPTGQPQPVVSTLNSSDGRIVANAAIVPAGTGGAVSFFATNATTLVVDINGYFATPGAGGLNFYTVTPCRLVDTRNANSLLGGPIMGAGTTRTFPLAGTCGLPNTASAYSLNFTVVPQSTLGYLTTWPTGAPQPVVSTLNSPLGLIVANAALVPAGPGGSINVFVTDPTHVIVDTNGYFGQ